VWIEFLRGLVARGLAGVELVISDAQCGTKAAFAQVLSRGFTSSSPAYAAR
jgi:transposase-like protein